METLLTCPCGGQSWFIGQDGTRCVNCLRRLPLGYVHADVARVNRLILVAYLVETRGDVSDDDRQPGAGVAADL